MNTQKGRVNQDKMKQEIERKTETQEEAETPGNKDPDPTQLNEVPIARRGREDREEERARESHSLDAHVWSLKPNCPGNGNVLVT